QGNEDAEDNDGDESKEDNQENDDEQGNDDNQGNDDGQGNDDDQGSDDGQGNDDNKGGVVGQGGNDGKDNSGVVANGINKIGTTGGGYLLPKTATNTPLLIAIGSILSIAGGAILFIRRKIMNE